MFPRSYFGATYFAPTYFPPIAGEAAPGHVAKRRIGRLPKPVDPDLIIDDDEFLMMNL